MQDADDQLKNANTSELFISFALFVLINKYEKRDFFPLNGVFICGKSLQEVRKSDIRFVICIRSDDHVNDDCVHML